MECLYKATDFSHKYIKLVLTDKQKNKKKWCGLLEERTEDTAVRDFLDTLHEPYMWTPNVKKIWLESGVIDYTINNAIEFTPEYFVNIEDDQVYLFPKSYQFLSQLDRDSDGELFVYCYSPFDNKYYSIPIAAFYSLLPLEDRNIFTFLHKLCGNLFSITRPTITRIQFSDNYDCINTNYRKSIKTVGKLTIL